MCNLLGSLVNMNSSTSMSSWLFFASWNHSLCSFKIQILISLIILQGIAFELVSLLVVMFLCWIQMLMFTRRLSNLFWKRLNLMWSLAWLLNLAWICHPIKGCKLISIVSKLTLIIFECLFLNYFASNWGWCFVCSIEIFNPIILNLFSSMLGENSSQAPFQLIPCQNMLRTLLDTWPPQII